jgi:hypothetical protein
LKYFKAKYKNVKKYYIKRGSKKNSTIRKKEFWRKARTSNASCNFLPLPLTPTDDTTDAKFVAEHSAL